MFDDQPPRAGVVAVERRKRDAVGNRLQQPLLWSHGVLVPTVLVTSGPHDQDSTAIQRRLRLDRRVYIGSSPLGEDEPVGLIEKNFEESGRHVSVVESRLRNARIRTIKNPIRLAALRYRYRVLSGAVAEMARGQFRNQFTAYVIGVEGYDAIGSRAENRHNSFFWGWAFRDDESRKVLVDEVEHQRKHRVFDAAFRASIHFELDGFERLAL